jgi:hypothetical protein
MSEWNMTTLAIAQGRTASPGFTPTPGNLGFIVPAGFMCWSRACRADSTTGYRLVSEAQGQWAYTSHSISCVRGNVVIWISGERPDWYQQAK